MSLVPFIPLRPSPAMQESLARLEAQELRAEADRLFADECNAAAAGDETLAADLMGQAWALITKARDVEFRANVTAYALRGVAGFSRVSA